MKIKRSTKNADRKIEAVAFCRPAANKKMTFRAGICLKTKELMAAFAPGTWPHKIVKKVKQSGNVDLQCSV